MTPPTTCDVLVLGAGPGGMAAAVEAARAGAEVVVVEAGERIGGNAARSTGYLAFLDSALQRQEGISDSEDAFLTDALNEVALQQERFGIVFDVDLTRAVVRGSTDTYRFLTELGFTFNRFIRRPLQHTVDRMIDVADTALFTTCFERAFEDLGVRVLTRTRAVDLILDTGRVAGAVLDPAAEVRTRGGGVVLATGGYQANPALRQRYQPAYLATTPYLGLDTCRGDGHVLGQAVGGDLVNMTMIPPLVMVASAFVEESIAVNLEGRRFHDEAGPYDDRVAALHAQPQRLGFYVCDGDVLARKGSLVEQMPQPARTAPTLAGLAAEIGCDAANLEATVARWNRTVAASEQHDADFGRVIFPDDRRGIVAPPFAAVPMVVGINFPAGGFRVSPRMEVADVRGRVIPGLFAVGDCVGGVNPAAGLGGMHICSALTLGRIAGRAALTAAPQPSPAGADLLAAHPIPVLQTTIELVQVPS